MTFQDSEDRARIGSPASLLGRLQKGGLWREIYSVFLVKGTIPGVTTFVLWPSKPLWRNSRPPWKRSLDRDLLKVTDYRTTAELAKALIVGTQIDPPHPGMLMGAGLLARRSIPDLQRPVRAAADNLLAIGTQSQVQDRTRMSLEGADLPACGCIPDL